MPDTANLERAKAAQTGAIRVAGLDHLVLRVADLDRAIRFYGEVLGCRVERRLEEPNLVQPRAGASMIDLVAPGLAVLEEIAGEFARGVWVVAPEHDQSGVSHAVSLHHPIRVTERGQRRYAISGTPGDCAVMGVCHLMADAAPDLLLCGVNRG